MNAPCKEQELAHADRIELDRRAIIATARDYIEGYLYGDAERIRCAVHAKLAKRVMRIDERTAQSQLTDMNALELVEATRARRETGAAAAHARPEVHILDLFENMACVKVVAANWIDYLHLTRFNGRWLIINVLWDPKPSAPR